MSSVVDDYGPPHPQTGVWVWGGQHQPLRSALGDPAEGDLLTGLSTGAPQLGPGQQPPGPPGFPGDKEEAVVGGIDPVGAPLTDHDSSSGVSGRAGATVVQQRSTRRAWGFCASVRVGAAVVVEAAFSQHAVGAMGQRGQEAAGRGCLEARGAMGAWCLGCWTRL